jgi:hypothetical protein
MWELVNFWKEIDKITPLEKMLDSLAGKNLLKLELLDEVKNDST